MKYLIWILLLFAAAVAVTTASHNPAYVLLVYPPYRIELSLTLFIILLLIGFAFGYGVVRLVLAAMQLPAYVHKFRLERAQAKARELLEEALGAFFEGRYAAAEKASARAMELGDTSALHPIIAARSAHELHEYQKRDAYLSAAEGKTVGEATMRLMETTKFMLDQRDPQAALQALQQLRNTGVKGHVGALSLELKAQQQAGNWNEVLNVLDQLEKRGRSTSRWRLNCASRRGWRGSVTRKIWRSDRVPEEHSCRPQAARQGRRCHRSRADPAWRRFNRAATACGKPECAMGQRAGHAVWRLPIRRCGGANRASRKMAPPASG